MSRLREKLPAYLQRRFGICRRTFERWCAQGDVPGAYRTRGGHWRVRKPAWAMVKLLLCRRAKTRRDQVWLAIIDYPFNPVYPSAADIARREAMMKFTLAADGITDEDIYDPNLEERDPEKYHILWKKSPPTLHPRALEAVSDPRLAITHAAYMIRHNGRKVTTTSLACALHVSVATLYRKYGKREIRRVCAPAI